MESTVPNTQQTQNSLWIKTFPVGPLQCNCTIIADVEAREAIIVDPGGDGEKILKVIQDLDEQYPGMAVKQIVHTHAHFDHFLASGYLREKTEAPLGLHKEDAFLWEQLETQCALFGVPFVPAPPPDQWLEHEETLCLSHHHAKALHTPGHSPGSMCFQFDSAKLLVAGDTLFRGSIGRTDLWGGDFNTIKSSIRNVLYTLDEAFKVVPGHGPSTTLGDEMRYNQIVRAVD